MRVMTVALAGKLVLWRVSGARTLMREGRRRRSAHGGWVGIARGEGGTEGRGASLPVLVSEQASGKSRRLPRQRRFTRHNVLPPSPIRTEQRVPGGRGVGWDAGWRHSANPLGDGLNLQGIYSITVLLLLRWCRLATVLPGMGHKNLGWTTRRGALTHDEIRGQSTSTAGRPTRTGRESQPRPAPGAGNGSSRAEILVRKSVHWGCSEMLGTEVLDIQYI